MYSIWLNQIGRPSDELTALTLLPDQASAEAANARKANLADLLPSVLRCSSEVMTLALQPEYTNPPYRQGNYVFRWFELPWKTGLNLWIFALPPGSASQPHATAR